VKREIPVFIGTNADAWVSDGSELMHRRLLTEAFFPM